MQFITKISQARHFNAKFKTILGLTLGVLLTILYFFPPLYNAGTPFFNPQAARTPVAPVVPGGAIDKAAAYHLYSQIPGLPSYEQNETPGSEGSGIVVDAWRANTVENRRACLSLWLFDRAHESFCKALNNTTIFAVREPKAFNGRIAYVSVVSSVPLALGKDVTFKRGSTGTSGGPSFLPTLYVAPGH